MKLVSNLVFLLCAYSMFNSYSTQAQTNNISLKCHVELVGGKSTIIYHYHQPISDKDLFADWLLNEYKYSQGNNEVLSVYKVNECVETKDKFKDRVANTLEDGMSINR